MRKATNAMEKSKSGSKKTKSGAKEGKGGDSQLIDAKITELGDWRGETLAGSEVSSKRPTPMWSRRGSGEGFRCGRTQGSSALVRRTRLS